MKHFLLFLLILSISPLYSQVVENPGFEDWETTTGPNDEPVNWSSIQTGEPDNIAGFSPQVLFQSEDAYTGTYSIRLKNKYVVIAQVVANGLATNGRNHLDLIPENADSHTDISDEKWYTECTTRPDSVVGYYKYISVNGDLTTVQALVHTGEAKIPDPDSTGWVGMATFTSPAESTSGWVRFSAPFDYYESGDPEYILFIISSGNAFEAQEDSEGWYDDIELVYNPVGIDETFAQSLLNVYAENNSINIDLRKFGAGENFDLSIYSLTGQLILSDNITSGYTESWNMENSGMYICRLETKDGLILTKKVVIP